jgi:hypothetical protein
LNKVLGEIHFISPFKLYKQELARDFFKVFVSILDFGFVSNHFQKMRLLNVDCLFRISLLPGGSPSSFDYSRLKHGLRILIERSEAGQAVLHVLAVILITAAHRYLRLILNGTERLHAGLMNVV